LSSYQRNRSAKVKVTRCLAADVVWCKVLQRQHQLQSITLLYCVYCNVISLVKRAK